LLKAGVHPKVVSERFGNASERIDAALWAALAG